VLLLGAGVFGALEVAGQVEQVAQLARGVVFQAEQVAVVDVERHDDSPWFGNRPGRYGECGRGMVV
jgi:hypothetical protein